MSIKLRWSTVLWTLKFRRQEPPRSISLVDAFDWQPKSVKSFWHNIFFLHNIFFTHTSFGPKFFLHQKLSQTQHFFETMFLRANFFSQNYFGSRNIWTKIFVVQIYILGPNFFDKHFFDNQNSTETKNWFWQNQLKWVLTQFKLILLKLLML